MNELRVYSVVVLLLASMSAAHKSYAASFRVDGELRASGAEYPDDVRRELEGPDQTYLSDSAINYGTHGEVAEARYYANLTGSLGTYISADCPDANAFGTPGASAEATVSLYDQLTVTIPAGTYGEDLYVTLHGCVEGVFSAYGWDGNTGNPRNSNVYAVGSFRLGGGLGSETYAFDATDTAVYSNPDGSLNSRAFSHDFALSARVLYAGTYTSDRTAALTVSAYLKSKGAGLSFYPSTNPGSETSGMCSDF